MNSQERIKMKRIIIILVVIVAIVLCIRSMRAATRPYRTMTITLEPRLVDAYCKRHPKPRHLSKETWTKEMIWKQIQGVVESVEIRELEKAIVVDVNEVGR